MVDIKSGFKPGELNLMFSSTGHSSTLEQLDKMMTGVLFANGQDERYQSKFLLNNHNKLNYWTEQLRPGSPHRDILMEIYEIMDRWEGGWTRFWQHVSPTLFPYLGEDPMIKSIETLMK